MIWVIAALAVVIIGARLFAPGQFQTVDTSVAVQLIQTNQVEKAVMVNGDQQLELTLKTAYQGKGKLVMAYYVDARGPELVTLLTQHQPSKGFNDEVPKQSWWGSLLMTVVPLLLILGLFWFLMGQMQGGGSG